MLGGWNRSFLFTEQEICLFGIILLIYELIPITEALFPANETYVDQTSFFNQSTVKSLAGNPPQPIRLMAFCCLYKETLHLMDNSRNSGKVVTQTLFVSEPGVDGFACLTHDEEVLPDVVELSQLIVDYHVVLKSRVDFLWLEKSLNSLLFGGSGLWLILRDIVLNNCGVVKCLFLNWLLFFSDNADVGHSSVYVFWRICTIAHFALFFQLWRGRWVWQHFLAGTEYLLHIFRLPIIFNLVTTLITSIGCLPLILDIVCLDLVLLLECYYLLHL